MFYSHYPTGLNFVDNVLYMCVCICDTELVVVSGILSMENSETDYAFKLQVCSSVSV
jgi:hypothetical protein